MNSAASFLVNGMADCLCFGVISRMTAESHGDFQGKYQKRTLR